MEWTIICDPKSYNVAGAFERLPKIDWKQSTNIQVNDIIYIYVTSPIKAIRYKCMATKVDLTENQAVIDDSDFVLDGTNYQFYKRYMELEFIEEYDDERLHLNNLRKNGFKSVQGQSKVSGQLHDYLHEVTGEIRQQYNVNNNYPPKYVTRIPITSSQWCELLRDQEIFTDSNIQLLKRFYISANHAAACYDLATQDGIYATSYTGPIVALAKRISKKMQLSKIIGTDGKQTWWRILFWGRYREDGHFEWKLQPELAQAMNLTFPGMKTRIEEKAEYQKDNELLTVDELQKKVVKFRDERNWKQFHNPKDLAISISLEAAELLEVFQWSGADTEVMSKREKVEEELADVLIYCALMAEATGLDITDIVMKKLKRNDEKYPVKKSYGNKLKYTELGD